MLTKRLFNLLKPPSSARQLRRKLAGAILALPLLSACGSTPVEHYQANEPTLKLEQFFSGHLTAHGILRDFSGDVTRYFNATIEARWNEAGEGTLDEYFEFNDGEKQRRVWTLIPQGNGEYTATANDTKGEANTQVAGNAFFMNYVLTVNYQGDDLDVSVEDQMFLVAPNVIINQSTLRKFGVTVGEVTLTIIKH